MKKKILGFILLIILFIGLTSCGNKVEEGIDEDVEPQNEYNDIIDDSTSGGKTILENEYVTIKFIKREIKSLAGMENGEIVYYKLPTILLSIKNNYGEPLHFETRASEYEKSKINYGFVMSNEKGLFDYTGLNLAKDETLKTNIYYSQIKYEQREYPLSTLDDKNIFLRLYEKDEYGGNIFINEYKLNTNILK